MRSLVCLFILGFVESSCGEHSKSNLHNFAGVTPEKADQLYMVLGGGPNRQNSQIVLEANMKLFDLVLEKFMKPIDTVTRLFASGPKSGLEDIVSKNSGTFSADDELLIEDLLSVFCPSCSFRTNQLDHADGALDRKQYDQFFSEAQTKVDAKDEFRFFFTGHGTRKKNNAIENSLILWEGDELTVQEFTKDLDKINSEALVQVVMVQCFSGGFSQINYKGGDIENPELSTHNRCGFYSQIAPMPAAGCSPDLLMREEYSPYFLAAYLGVDEKGVAVDADYNQDGIVSAWEAHMHVVGNEKSFDLPISTSTDLLNKHLVLEDDVLNEVVLEDVRSSTDLVAVAKSIEQLAKDLQIDLPEDNSLRPSVVQKIAEASYEMKRHASMTDFFASKYEKIREKLIGEIVQSDLSSDLFNTDLPKFMQDLKALPSFESYWKAKQRLRELGAVYEESQKRAMRLNRIVYYLDFATKHQLLAAQPKTHEFIKKYDALRACEEKPYF